MHCTVPAHAGGVDLSFSVRCFVAHDSVPAHAGGVDLSQVVPIVIYRVGMSPPMRAGWI